MYALRALLLLLAIHLSPGYGRDELADLSNAIASELEEGQIEELDEALYEGFVQGIALNFDYVSFRKQASDDHVETTEEKKKEEHAHNLEKAELTAEYLTRHRPLESAEVEETESDIYSILNMTIHYMMSRAQKWHIVEPKNEGLIDGMENHMIFISEASDGEDRHIPRNMILSVGNISKTLPHKNGKTPILFTCLETFIVSKLAYNLMSKLVNSTAPIDVKLKYIERWIHLAKNHFVLYLPYVTITAQRCFDLLDSGELKGKLDDAHYSNLHKNCKIMIDKRDQESDLQTFVMLDPEIHSELIEKCIEQRHIIPSLLEEKETHLRRIHNVLDKEMSWEIFSSAMNMVLADVEKVILNNEDYFMKPSTWGCGISKKEASEAENKLIAAFAKSHVQLNLKVRSTILALGRVLSDAAKDKGSSLANSLLQFVEQEYNSALEEAKTNEELSKCMDDAKLKFTDEAKMYEDHVTKSSYTKGIAVDMRNYQNEGWMPCMSARIMGTITETCAKSPHYCKVLLDVLRETIVRMDPDSTSALIMENFHNVVSVSLLKNKEITAEELRSYLIQVTKRELNEVNSVAGGKNAKKDNDRTENETKGHNNTSAPENDINHITDTEGATAEHGSVKEDREPISEEKSPNVQSETKMQEVKEH